MFEQAFENIDDVVWKESGFTTEFEHTEPALWLLLNDLEGVITEGECGPISPTGV